MGFGRLSDLKPGQGARVVGLRMPGETRCRMQDVGLIDGTYVRCVGLSPLGDPAAYEIRGAVMALRRRDAVDVEVRM